MPSKEGDYMLNKRKNYIDNIRSFGVILVLIYHVFYIYNGLGVLGGVPTIQSVGIFDNFLTIVYPWMMILMFTAAGVAAKVSLEKRTNKEFIRERARKLLIPSTLGLFVIHWITGYLNIYFGGGLNEIPHFLVYPISVLSGQGHLWFAQTLFLYSLILVFGKKTIDKFYKMGKRAGFVVCVSLSILIWLSAQIFNMPIITVYRFGIYCVSFLIGYCVFSHDTVVEKIEKNRYFSLILCIVFGIIYFTMFNKMNYTEPTILKNIITNFYAWATVLAIFGFAKRYMDGQNSLSNYLSTNSYGFYVLHYPVLMIIVYFLNILNLNIFVKVLVALILELVFTFVANEAIKRISIVRYVVLGIKRRKNEIQIDN